MSEPGAASVNQTISPEHLRRIDRTWGSSALRTAKPFLGTASTTTALTAASWARVSIPRRPRWSGATLVTTATSLRSYPRPSRSMPPRATSMTAKSTRGFMSTIRADFGPDASALMTSRSSMTTPSVEVMPTLRPKPLKMWAIIREVVVLPLVPVTATIGTREGAPGGKSRSTTGLAMNCGTPTVGCVCIRKPGAALTSTMAPPVSRTGAAMSGQMKSMPATSRPTIRAASSAISTLSGWASKVRSTEMPPVDMLPVRASLTMTPASGTSVRR